MSEDFFQIRERLRREASQLRLVPASSPSAGPPKMATDVVRSSDAGTGDGFVLPEGGFTPGRVLVVENDETGKTYVTMPAEAAALEADDFLLRLRGRFVGEGANRNKAAWSAKDLEFGLPSVASGPLNWLHDERHIIGTLTDARLREAAGQVPKHIEADAVVWRYLFPREAAVVGQAAADGRLYYSMECVSRQVQCVGDGGCGAVMGYLDSLHKTEKACVHVRERASDRRFVDPIFQGGAVIVPPKTPGWENAHVELLRDAERVLPEAAAATDGDVALGAQILQFVREGAA